MTNLKKFDTNLEKRTPLKAKRYLYLGVVLLLFLVVFEIWVNNTLATFGAKYENISNLQKTLKLENQVLENEIAKQISMISIATESASFGFTKSKDIQYIR